MGRKSKRSLTAITQRIEKGHRFGSPIVLSTSRFCSLVDEDFIDLVGEDIDNFFDEEDNQSSSDADDNDNPTIEERAKTFWNSTIDWSSIDVSFQREGESRRTLQRKRQAEKMREGSMKKRSLNDTVSRSGAKRSGC